MVVDLFKWNEKRDCHDVFLFFWVVMKSVLSRGSPLQKVCVESNQVHKTHMHTLNLSWIEKSHHLLSCWKLVFRGPKLPGYGSSRWTFDAISTVNIRYPFSALVTASEVVPELPASSGRSLNLSPRWALGLRPLSTLRIGQEVVLEVA